MIEQKTGWSADEVLDRVGIQVTTLGADGVRIQRARRGADRACRRPRTSRAVEPTGVGDAFRAGFLAALDVGAGPRARGPGRLRARGVRRGDGRHRRSTRSPPSSSSARLDDVLRRRARPTTSRPHLADRAQLSRRTR